MHEVEGCAAYFVRDNGVGFDTTEAKRYSSLSEGHAAVNEFAGLAMAVRIIKPHGGKSRPWEDLGGSHFLFTSPMV